jgi:hypothetical protein
MYSTATSPIFSDVQDVHTAQARSGAGVHAPPLAEPKRGAGRGGKAAHDSAQSARANVG